LSPLASSRGDHRTSRDSWRGFTGCWGRGQSSDGIELASNLFAVGEQEFSWLSSRKLENATLERGNRWKVYWLRTVDTVDEGDVVQADLHGIFDVSDVGEYCETIEVTEDQGEQQLESAYFTVGDE
jgi:hypothetical protein